MRRAAAAAAKKLPYFKGKNFLLKCSERPEDYFFGQALVFPEDEASAVLQPAYDNGPLAHELAAPFYARVKGQDEVTKKQYLDMNMWLPGDILLKADKMCMAHSACRSWTKRCWNSPKRYPWITASRARTRRS